MSDRVYNILNLGAGIQSSRVILASCRGEIPKFDAAIFADTKWEPKAVYANLEFLGGEAAKAGIPILVGSKGNLRDDAIAFRRFHVAGEGKHKRYASIPVFIKNEDGSQGRVKRQCTKEYKIEVVESIIRTLILELKPRKRVPKGVLIRQWFGISDDEGTRAVYPGKYKTRKVLVGTDLLGTPVYSKVRRWHPCRWKENVYPLLNEAWLHDRTIRAEAILPRREQREHCRLWLARHYPGRTFPRSACIACPFRSNAEWREMRDQRPEEFEDACLFDEQQRQAQEEGKAFKKQLRGTSYVHRQLVPLRMADLSSGVGEKGGGCGTLMDGQDGMCDV